MLAGRYDNATARAGFNVDMWIDAALADELKLGQALEQSCLNFRALANEHQAFGVLQAGSQRVSVLDMIVPDNNIVSF